MHHSKILSPILFFYACVAHEYTLAIAKSRFKMTHEYNHQDFPLSETVTKNCND